MSSLKSIKNKLFKPIDLTQGTPWKVIIAFLIPILISNVFQQIYSISDAIIVGQVIPRQFAGINDTNSICFLILQFAFGTTAGMSVLMSEWFGKKFYDDVKKSFIAQIFICIVVSVILTTLSLVLLDQILEVIGLSNTKDPVSYSAARNYLIVIFAGLSAQIFYNLIVSVCRSIGDSLTPLLFLILSTVINIICDIISVNCISGDDAKVIGVALATVLSQLLSAILCFIYSLKKYPFLRFNKSDLKYFKFELFKHLKMGLPLGFQFSILAIGIIVLQNTIVNFDFNNMIQVGDTLVAPTYCQDAFGAANKLTNFISTISSSLGAAMLSYMAQNKGVNDYKRIKVGFKSGGIIGLIFTAFATLLITLLSIKGAFLYIFIDKECISEQTIYYGQTYLLVYGCFYVFLNGIHFTRNSVQGLGKPLWPLIAGVAELAARILVCIYLPIIIAKVSNLPSIWTNEAFIGICFATPAAWVVATTIMIFPLVISIKRNTRLNELEDRH